MNNLTYTDETYQNAENKVQFQRLSEIVEAESRKQKERIGIDNKKTEVGTCL